MFCRAVLSKFTKQLFFSIQIQWYDEIYISCVANIDVNIAQRMLGKSLGMVAAAEKLRPGVDLLRWSHGFRRIKPAVRVIGFEWR